jgi:tRNA A37 N6-isopentenylltransferase MiaA
LPDFFGFFGGGAENDENPEETLQREIWHYAKRQMTWFKRDKEIVWCNPEETKKIDAAVSGFLRR